MRRLYQTPAEELYSKLQISKEFPLKAYLSFQAFHGNSFET